MSYDQFKRGSNVVKIPLVRHLFKPVKNKTSQRVLQDEHQIQQLRAHITKLKHFLDIMPAFETMSCDDVTSAHFEHLDNYICVVGEIICALYELNHLNGNDEI